MFTGLSLPPILALRSKLAREKRVQLKARVSSIKYVVAGFSPRSGRYDGSFKNLGVFNCPNLVSRGLFHSQYLGWDEL